MAGNIALQKRRGTLTLNRLQAGVLLGFVAISLLLTFGAGFMIGMWYRASEHVTPFAAHESPVIAPKSPARGQDMTFYTTLAPEPAARPSGTVSTPLPPQPTQSARGAMTAPPPQSVSLPPAKAPERGGTLEMSPLPQKPGPSSARQVLPQPAEAGYSVQVGRLSNCGSVSPKKAILSGCNPP